MREREPNVMPVILVSDAAFANLKHIATWLEADTPAQTIDLLVANEMERLGLERDSEADRELVSRNGENILVFENENTPGLSFTRVLSASIGGRGLERNSAAGGKPQHSC